MSKLVAVRIKQNNGSYSNEIPIGALTQNITYNINNTNYNLRQILGQVDMLNANKGSVQHQLDTLFNQFATYIPSVVTIKVDEALADHQWISGDAIIDPTLSSSDAHAAAQAAAVQKVIAYGDADVVAGTKLKINPNFTTINVLTTEDNVAYRDMITANAQDGDAEEGTAEAHKDYNIGEYIAISTKLYKTITTISNNTTFSIGTNIEEVPLAESVNANTQQITTNAGDIADLKEQINNIWNSFTSEVPAIQEDYQITGIIRAVNGLVTSGTNRLTTINKFNNENIFNISLDDANNYGFYLYAWDGDTYLGSYRNGNFAKTAGAELLTEIRIADFPESYNFLVNAKRVDNADVTLEEAEHIKYSKNRLGPDNTLTQEGQAADSKTVGDKFTDVYNKIISIYNANPDDFYISGAISSVTGVVGNGTNRLTNYNKISHKNILEISVTDESEYGFYLYAWDGDTYLGSYRNGNFAKTAGAQLLTNHNIEQYPASYKFLINLKRVDNTDINKDEAENIIYTALKTYEIEEKTDSDATYLATLGLHTVPESSGVLNCIRRTRQMTDVKWTPAVDLPRVCRVMGNTYDHNEKYEDVFKAGVEYTGIPYSNTVAGTPNNNGGYGRQYVGFDLSIETFITAIQNKNSVISKDSYYNPTTVHSTIYGLVCSALVSYALGLSSPKTTSGIPSIHGLNKIGKMIDGVNKFDLSTIKLCDVFNKINDHAVIVTDIVKDKGGNIKYIEISEETIGGNGNPANKGGQNGGLARRRGFTPDEIYEYYGEYDIHRYTYLDSITYEKSDFVNTGGELDMFRLDSLPCMPYMGENAIYKASALNGTKILINCTGYDFLRAYKDGAELSGSPFAITNATESVETGFNSAGNYEAYLCNITDGNETSRTLSCHWSVI